MSGVYPLPPRSSVSASASAATSSASGAGAAAVAIGSGAYASSGAADSARTGTTLSPLRVCGWCGISHTTQWRIGPTSGSLQMSTLCNACGINYRRTLRKLGCDESRLDLDVLAKQQGTVLSIGKALKRQRNGLARLSVGKRRRDARRVDVRMLLCDARWNGAYGDDEATTVCDTAGGTHALHACAQDVQRWGEEDVQRWGEEDVQRWGEEDVQRWGEEDVQRWGEDAQRWGEAAQRCAERVEVAADGESERLPSFRDFIARFSWGVGGGGGV